MVNFFWRFFIILTVLQIPLLGQAGEAGLILFTEVRSHRIRKLVELPGTVGSGLISTVASEIAGIVQEYPVREGQVLEAGEILARLRRRSLELQLRASEAQYHEDGARMKLAERTLARARDLFDRGVLSRQELDDAQFEFNAWEGRMERLNAELEELKHDIERSTIRAPYRGVVVAEMTQVGEWLEEGGAVLELLSLEHLEVNVELPERYFTEVAAQSRSRVIFEALPGVEVEGTVGSIIPRADPQARTFPLKLRIPNHRGRIGVGMLARVTIPIGQSYVSRVVPKDAVVTRGDLQYVYLLSDDDLVRRTLVQTGTGVGQWVEIQGPIETGEKVATQGNERLRDGQRVKPEMQEYPFP